MSRAWIDVTVGLRDGMPHWPGNPPVEIRRVKDVARGAHSSVSVLSMGSHTGTHVDAPAHFLPGRATIDRMPLDALMGPARVIAIEDPAVVDEPELARHRPRRGERLLLKTANSRRCWSRPAFSERFVHLTARAAELLARRGARAVGVDYLSVGGYKDPDAGVVHRALLGRGVWIIEGLDLSRAPAGPCELLCLPLKIVGGDGAPARALLRPR